MIELKTKKRAEPETGHPVQWEANCEVCDFCEYSNRG
jgi:hypothetical protein